MSENMGARIMRLRKEQNLTLEDVARIVGVGKSTVRKWETGIIANMRRDKIPLLAEALHTSPAYLLGYYEGENPLVGLSPSQQQRLYSVASSKCVKLNVPYEQLAYTADVSPVVLRKIKNGSCVSLRAADIRNLFNTLSLEDTDSHYIATGSDDYYEHPLGLINVHTLIEKGAQLDITIPGVLPVPKMRQVPLLGTIACGDPILAEENMEGFLAMPEAINADFALRCRGDSMINARIFDGDIVYIRQQPTVEDGEIAAVLIDNEATLKRVHFYPDRIALEPANPMYPLIVKSGEEMATVRILGKAVAFTSAVR